MNALHSSARKLVLTASIPLGQRLFLALVYRLYVEADDAPSRIRTRRALESTIAATQAMA